MKFFDEKHDLYGLIERCEDTNDGKKQYHPLPEEPNESFNSYRFALVEGQRRFGHGNFIVESYHKPFNSDQWSEAVPDPSTNQNH